MYPFIRLAKELVLARRRPKLSILEPHVSRHVIWPWDLDPWGELNNGRTLTLFDLGRVSMGIRMGLDEAAGKNGWGITVAGNSTRYRRRVTLFSRLELVSRVVGWDHRFVYIEQSFWKGAECTAHMLLRYAITSPQGIVPPARMLRALDQPEQSPPLPGWITAWIAAEAQRPWPPRR